MKGKMNIIEWAMKYKQIVLFIVAVLVLFGIKALQVMPKQEFPVFTIRQGVIVGIYPGATANEVEEQLAKPLEEFIFTYKEVKKAKTYSHSKDGVVYLYVELNDEVNNKDEVWSKIKHGLNNFKQSLPIGVLALIANDDFGDTSALLITLESDSKTHRQLQDLLESLDSRLRRIESVSNIRHYGLQNEQISIYIEKEKIARYGINLVNLYQTLAAKGILMPSGAVDNAEIVTPIHISRPFHTEMDIEEHVVYSDSEGNYIRLKDIAKVVREYPKPNSYITNNGKNCLVLSAEMRAGYNIVQFGKDVDAAIQEFQKNLPADVGIYRIADQPKVVDHSVMTFLRELLIAIIAVVLVTMLLLPLRVAGVAASSIPITIFISLGLMFALGIELNTVTLAALIVVLGMIVDNSIVVVDSYLEKLDQGIPRWKASIASAQEYFKSILSATLAISITFLPFLFVMTGQMLDFVRSFPWTVMITLGVSLAIALLVIPYMQYFFIRKGLHEAQGVKTKKTFLDVIQGGYNRLLEKVFQYPKFSLAVTILSILAGIYLFSVLPQRLMPIAERDQFAVEIYLPSGSSLEETTAVAKEMEAALKKDNRVVSVTAFMGMGSPRFQTSYAPKMGGKNFAQFIVNTTSNEATEELLDKFTDSYAHHFPNAYVRFKQLDYQAVESVIEVRISGDSLNDLKEKANALMTEFHKMEEPLRIWTDFEEPLPTIKVLVDPIEANRLGINELSLGMGIASRFGGAKISTLWEGDYAVPLVLKSQWEDKDPNIDDLGNEYVSGLLSPAVPLRQIAKVSADWKDGQIDRRNGVRTITVMMDLKRHKNTSKVQKKVEQIVDRFKQNTDMKNLTISYGGAKENDEETMPQMMVSFAIAVAIIFFILIFHFKSMRLAIIVLASCSLCLFGAALGIKIMGIDFSVTSVLGLVSLIGIIVRNGIIMFDYIKELRIVHHRSVYEAALEAGKRRMRPIFLTSAAASMGVIPMIISKSPLWCPMGTVICFGTLISMVFVLTVLPLVYYLVYRGQDKQQSNLLSE